MYMANHLVDIVNERDEVIGSDLKSRKAELGFISRASAVFLHDSDGNIVVCKRAPHKKFSPNLYDLAAVGSVCAGETYEEAARRELLEEVGITCDLTLLDVHYQEAVEGGALMRHFCGIFLGRSDEEPRLNDELSSWKKLSFQQLVEDLLNEPDAYCPGLVNDFRHVEEKLSRHFANWKSS